MTVGSTLTIVLCHATTNASICDLRARRRGKRHRNCDLGLGDAIPGDVEYFGYGVDYFGRDGNGGKRFGVRCHERPSPHVFEWTSATEANYESDSISLEADRLVVLYRDADLGLPEIGTIRAFSHSNGVDVQT